MVLEAWWATVQRVAKSQTQLKRLSMHTRKARMNPGFLIPSLLFFPLQRMDFPASYSFFLFFLFLYFTPFEFCPNSWAPVYQNSASTPSL